METTEAAEERYLRAREIYAAINMLMASKRVADPKREVAVIRSAVEADHFTYEEVFLAGLSESQRDFQKQWEEFLKDKEEEIPVADNRVVPFKRGWRGGVIATEPGPACQCFHLHSFPINRQAAHRR